MTCRSLAGLVAVGVWYLACGSACSPATTPPRNVIVILVDALRSDHLGVYGYDARTSPNIDRLSRSAYVYENAFSTSTWTVPGVASLFTGTLPVVHRVRRPPDDRFAFSVLDEEYLLASEVFESNGFATGMVTTIGWISELAGYEQGVDEFIKTQRADALLVSHALDFITKHRENRFHLYLHFIDLHDYYDPDLIFAEDHVDHLEPGSALYELRDLTPDDSYTHLNEQLSRDGRLTTDDIEWLLEVYDRELRKTDELIGLIVQHLRAQDLLDETVVVITADHGEQFLEHGTLTHGDDGFYNEVLRVPLVVAAPGILDQRATIHTPVSLIDVYPTVFDLLGLPPADLYQGRSILADDDPDRAVVATDGRVWKVITSKYSYISGRKGREELYDLIDDPLEQSNLIRRPAVAPIRTELLRHLQTVKAASERHDYLETVRHPGTAEMTEEERKALEALGYLK